MKILLFLFLLHGNPEGIDTTKCKSFHVSGLPFSEFTNLIYQKTGVKTYYNDASLNTIKVSIDSDCISPDSALTIALKGSEYKISVWHNNLILLKKETLLSNLPSYQRSTENKENSNTAQRKSNVIEEKYITGRKSNSSQTIRIGKNGHNKANINAKILGRILDKESGSPIIDASIYIEETGKGAITDKNGYLSFTIPTGKYNARVESLGHEKKHIFLEILSDGDFSMELEKEDLLIEEVLVYGDQQTNVKSKDPGLDRIVTKTVKEIPMMLGERDIIKVSSLLPGIVSIGEGSAGINVRGGNSDQNAFYIDKIPIYNTSHLFGFFPAFNSDIIKDFSIYKGYVPAEYGGRLSSVFNITTRQANRKHFTAHGGINPVTGYATVEGPIFNDSLTMFLSCRTSYSDWILSKINDPTIRNSSAVFNDFSTKLNYDMKKNQLSIFIYNSNDKFKLSDINKYQYSNLGGSLNLQHFFNSSIKSNISLIGSKYSFETTDNEEVSAAYTHDYKIEHYEVQGNVEHAVSDNMNLTYGADFILYKLDRGSVVPYGNYSLKSPINLGREKGIESALHITSKYNILPYLTFTLGFRQSLFTPIGPKSVYKYQPNSARELENIIDTVYYKGNKPIKWYFSPELRATLNLQTDKNGSVKVAFNQMQQNLYMLSNTISLAPNTQWKLADYYIKPSRSWQVSIGVFRNIPKENLETSIEFYIKRISNVPEFKDGASFTSTSAIETSVLQGNQKSYGVELFLKRSYRKLDGWVSYTYSRSFVKVDGKESWNKINEGSVYPANQDIPHSFNALINYHFSRRVSLSTVTTFQSGRPITYPEALFYMNGIQYVQYSKRNEYNIPNYFRIDASLTLEGNLKRNKLIHSSLMFSVYNLTGRRNPYSIYFKTEKGQIKCYKYSVIGIPLFTITWLFKLGNYASE